MTDTPEARALLDDIEFKTRAAMKKIDTDANRELLGDLRVNMMLSTYREQLTNVARRKEKLDA